MNPRDVLAIRPGRVLDGRLRLEERLGGGGSGDVWRATRLLGLTSPVAVKLSAPRCPSDVRATARLLREAALAKRVDSVHVVRVAGCRLSVDVGPYLVMELVEGLDLFEILSRRGPLPAAQAHAVIAQLCVALEAVHAAGVIHRDVKPDNIVLDRRNGRARVTLIDFGIARDAGAADPVSGMSATPGYMSPERVAGSARADAHGDLWSLAVVAYQCLVGRFPFQDSTPGAPLASVDGLAFAPPSTLRSDVAPALDGWFQRSFAPAPSARFASAGEMREAFLEASSLLSLEAPDPIPARTDCMAPPTTSVTRTRRSAPPRASRDAGLRPAGW